MLSCSVTHGTFLDQGIKPMSPAVAGRVFTPKPPGKPHSRCVFILKLPSLCLCWRVGLRLLEMVLLHFVGSTLEFIFPQGQILTNDWQLQGNKYSSCVALVRMNLRCDQHCLQSLLWDRTRVTLHKTLLNYAHLLILLTLQALFLYLSTSFSWENLLLIILTWMLISESVPGDPT